MIDFVNDGYKGCLTEYNAPYKITDMDYTHTGGGIVVFIGKLLDGTFFIADNFYAVRILTEMATWENDDAWFPEWQEKRLVKDLDTYEVKEFFKEIKRYIKASGCRCSDLDFVFENIDNWGV